MAVALDIVLALILIAYAIHGFRSGFVRSLGGIAGVVAGGIAAAFLAPLAGALVADPAWRTVVTIGVAVVLLLLGYGIGSRIGSGIGRGVQRTPLGPVDRVLGAVVQVAVTALVVSVLASLATTLRVPELQQPIAGSSVIGAIRGATPAPVEQALTQVQSTVLAADSAVVR